MTCKKDIERAIDPGGPTPGNRSSKGRKRSLLFQLNVFGHIARVTPIKRRDFRLNEKAGATFGETKKKI
jgi:hypothetical protein